MDAAELERLLQVRNGHAVNGQVFVRNFDDGMIFTMGAKVVSLSPTFKARFLMLPNVLPPPGLPGIPVVFAFPEDYFAKYKVPIVIVRRDSQDPAMERFQQGAEQFVVSAPGSALLPGFDGRTGPTRIVRRPCAIPHDFMYSITVSARHRGAEGTKGQVNALMQYIYSVYPPRSAVIVKDSLGMYRSYDTITESVSSADELLDVADRSAGYIFSIRVQGELDLESDTEQNLIRQVPQLTVDQFDEEE